MDESLYVFIDGNIFEGFYVWESNSVLARSSYDATGNMDCQQAEIRKKKAAIAVQARGPSPLAC